MKTIRIVAIFFWIGLWAGAAHSAPKATAAPNLNGSRLEQFIADFIAWQKNETVGTIKNARAYANEAGDLRQWLKKLASISLAGLTPDQDVDYRLLVSEIRDQDRGNRARAKVGKRPRPVSFPGQDRVSGHGHDIRPGRKRRTTAKIPGRDPQATRHRESKSERTAAVVFRSSRRNPGIHACFFQKGTARLHRRQACAAPCPCRRF